MNVGELLKLKGEIEFIRAVAEELREMIARMAVKVKASDPQEELVPALALNLQRFYTAVEDIIAHIARIFDQYNPAGPDWHRGLIQLAMVETPLRPAVFGLATARKLDKYRSFRHLLNRVSAEKIQWDKMEGLVEEVPGTMEMVSSDLNGFLRFLDATVEKSLLNGGA